MKETFQRNNGITIIALAITIIVLLILAGISIAMLSGDNGTIKQANKAKEQTEIQAEKENIDISVIEVLGQKTNGMMEKSDKDKFEENLRKNYNNQKIDVSVLENQDPYIFEVTYLESKRKYYVTIDGDFNESIEKRLTIEYKTTDGKTISKKMLDYTKEEITVGELELSEEIKEENKYEFQSAEIEKADGSKEQVSLTDKIILDENINKVLITYNQKIIKKSTVTMNPGQGSITGEKTKEGESGTQITIPTPTPPSGYNVTLNPNEGQVSQTTIKSTYSFDRWSLTGGGKINGNIYTFGEQNGTLTASYTHKGITLPTPTKDGYTFKGWYTSSSGGTKVGDAGNIYTPTSNITLYARWADETAPVITNLYAGVDTVTIEATDAGSGITKYAVSTNSIPNNFTQVENTKNLRTTVYGLNEGTTYYVCVQDEAGNQSEFKTITTSKIPRFTLTINPGQGSITGSTTKEGINGEQITIPTPTPPSGYNVTLNANGGYVSQTTMKSTYSFNSWSLTGGGKINGNIYTFGEQNGTLTASYTHKGITLPTPTKDGYTFKGWYTSSSGGTKVGDAGNIYTPTSNITLYARWADETAPVITNLYAGVDTVTIEATDAGSGITKYAVSTNSIPNNFTQVENTKNLRTTVYGLNEGTTYYVCVQDEAGNQSEFKTITTSKIPRFTLTINPGQGSITGSTTKEGINGEQITIPTPTPPSGYNVTLNANGGYVSQTTMKSTYSFNSWSLTGGGTIYGNTYTFGSQDGMLTASYRHTGITLPRPTKDRYTFKGWYTSSSGGTKVGDAGNIYTPTNNVTLYARWEAQIPSLITNTNVWFTPDITTWTNQDVNVSVTTTETNWTLQLTTGNPLEESSWISANRITVKENGTIYARLTDGQTSGGYASYNINNIDKTPPKKLVKGILTITRDNVKNNAYLNLNVINELESGVAKIECFYKTELDSYYSQQTIIEYAPMYGSQTGMVTESGRQTCTINSDRFSGQTIYMYAEIWDVAGNMSRTWLATISPDGHTTTYTEI